MKKSTVVLFGMLVVLLAWGLAGCSQPTGGGGGGGGGVTTGEFRLKITDIPSSVWSSATASQVYVYPANTFDKNNPRTGWVGARGSGLSGDDTSGSAGGKYWFEFSLYTDNQATKLNRAAGNFDIAIAYATTSNSITGLQLLNKPLAPGVNTISFTSFKTIQ